MPSFIANAVLCHLIAILLYLLQIIVMVFRHVSQVRGYAYFQRHKSNGDTLRYVESILLNVGRLN